MLRKIIKKIIKFFFPDLFNDAASTLPLSTKNTSINYYKKTYMTKSEIIFYNKLKDLELKSNYKVFPQINLASIIEKNIKYRTELFRNIDFGVFDEHFNIKLLIELNDKTHSTSSRKSRDIKVKKLCQEVGIPLISFYTNMPNEKEYIINRVLNELNKDVQKTK